MLSVKFDFRSQVVFWILLLLPAIMQLPALTGHWNPDPAIFVGGFGDSFKFPGGYPWIDPNNGFQSQALGRLSADKWLSGQIPWWNSFNGIGLPLAAEGSPGALFLPFVLLYHFRDAVSWVEILLQIIAGFCTYSLCRKLNLTKLAALTGGVLFELNGTFAWHGVPIVSPIAFLPMLLLGVEQLHERITRCKSGGWVLISIAIAWSLYTGFPETAYIDGLLTGLWVLARLGALNGQQQKSFLTTLVFAVCIGLLCSLPLIVPFTEYLQLAFVGGHDGSFAHASLPGASSLLSVMPWLFGPIDLFNNQTTIVSDTWSNIGGYLTALQVSLAVLGVMFAPRRLTVALLAWMVLCLAKTYDWRPVSDLVNLIPFIKSTAFYRYSPPSWELCGSILVAISVDALQRRVPISQKRQSFVFVICLLFICVGVWSYWDCFQALFKAAAYGIYFYWSVAWLLISLFAASCLMWKRQHWRLHVHLLVLLLFLDAGLAFALPIFSGAQDVKSDESGVAFLQSHLGLHRFYSLGPVAPNYGAYFQIAQINHNQLPISQDWVDYIHSHLDPAADAISFNGYDGTNIHNGTAESALQMHLRAYEDVAVKYVVSPHGTNPFHDELITQHSETNNKPLVLENHQSVRLKWRLPIKYADSKITGLAVVIGNYNDKADGILIAKICIINGPCAAGTASLQGSIDDAELAITLDHSLELPLRGATQLSIELSHEHSHSDMAIWVWPISASSNQKLSIEAVAPGFVPAVSLRLVPADNDGVLVYSKKDMDIYELAHAKPYFEILGGPCTLETNSRVLATVDCKSPAQLLRREAFYPGWQVRINGKQFPLERVRELFQQVNLAAGKQRIAFAYVPSHFRLIELGFGIGVLALLFAVWQEWLTHMAKSEGTLVRKT